MACESAKKFAEDILNQPEQETGEVPISGVGVDPGGDRPARPREEPLKVTLKRRLEREGRWAAVEPIRDRMMSDCRKQGMSKADAQQWTYAELDRMYPPEPVQNGHDVRFENAKPASDKDFGDSARVQGLQDIPSDWPDLPGNASLQAELAWVQAQRLRVVHEQPGGSTVVDLSRATAPAPSMAALSWLETSVRSYAKYVDVCAKATSTQHDEAEVVKRERMSIEEARSLLAEMVGDPTCPKCGRPV